MLHFDCPSCHAKCEAAPECAGMTVACAKCGTMVSVPSNAAVMAAPAFAPVGPAPTTAVTTPEIADQQQAKRRADLGADGWPDASIAKPRAVPQRSGAWLLLVGLALGAGLLVFMAWDSIAHTFRGSSKGPVVELTDANWQEEVVDSKVPVLVDFWAPWCGPCIKFGPTIDKLALTYEGKVKVGKLNVDNAQQIAAKYKITSIPCIMVFNGGDQPAKKFVGAQTSEAELANALNAALARK